MLDDLNHLRTFVAVADAGSHAAAAVLLNITPSAVSQQMKLLEARMEAPLFERVGRRSVLTPDGQTFVDRIRPLLGGIDEAVEHHRERHREIAGAVRVGSATGFFAAWMRPRLVPLLYEHPRLRLRARFTLLSRLQADLVAGELDLGVAVGVPEHPAIEAAPLYQQEFVAVGASTRLGDDTALSPEQLREQEFLVFDDDEFMHRDWWRAVFGPREPLPANITHHLGNIFELRAFMEQGLGLAVLPEFFVRDVIEAGSVRRIEPRGARGGRITRRCRSTVHLLWRRRSVEPRRVAVVRQSLLDHASQEAVAPRY